MDVYHGRRHDQVLLPRSSPVAKRLDVPNAGMGVRAADTDAIPDRDATGSHGIVCRGRLRDARCARVLASVAAEPLVSSAERDRVRPARNVPRWDVAYVRFVLVHDVDAGSACWYRRGVIEH